MNPQKVVAGKKVYLLGAAAIVYGLSLTWTGEMEPDQAMKWMWSGGVAMAARAAVAKLMKSIEGSGQ